MDDRNPLGTFWFRTAFAMDDRLSQTLVLAPGSDVRLGTRDDNELVIPCCDVESFLLLEGGTLIHLREHWLVKMAGHVEREDAVDVPVRIVHGHTSSSVRVRSLRVNLQAIREGFNVFIGYHPSREEAERG